MPWLRHAGGTQRPVLSSLWLGPLTDRREVESRSPVVVSEDDSMSEKRDYYDVLGVEKSASAGDLKNAFRRLARKYHPDRSTEEDAEDRFKEIQEAYAVLSMNKSVPNTTVSVTTDRKVHPSAAVASTSTSKTSLVATFSRRFLVGALGAVQPVADQTSSFVTPFRFEMFFLGRNKKSWSTSRNPAKRATERAPKMAS